MLHSDATDSDEIFGDLRQISSRIVSLKKSFFFTIFEMKKHKKYTSIEYPECVIKSWELLVGAMDDAKHHEPYSVNLRLSPKIFK